MWAREDCGWNAGRMRSRPPRATSLDGRSDDDKTTRGSVEEDRAVRQWRRDILAGQQKGFHFWPAACEGATTAGHPGKTTIGLIQS